MNGRWEAQGVVGVTANAREWPRMRISTARDAKGCEGMCLVREWLLRVMGC